MSYYARRPSAYGANIVPLPKGAIWKQKADYDAEIEAVTARTYTNQQETLPSSLTTMGAHGIKVNRYVHAESGLVSQLGVRFDVPGIPSRLFPGIAGERLVTNVAVRKVTIHDIMIHQAGREPVVRDYGFNMFPNTGNKGMSIADLVDGIHYRARLAIVHEASIRHNYNRDELREYKDAAERRIQECGFAHDYVRCIDSFIGCMEFAGVSLLDANGNHIYLRLHVSQ